MCVFQNLIITEIYKPFTVFSQRGRMQQINCRKWHGLSFCISGQITYTIDGKQYVSHPGNAIWLPMGGTYTLHGDREGQFPVINFHCLGDTPDTIMEFPLDNPQTCIKEFEKLRSLFFFDKTRLKRFSLLYALLGRVLADTTPSQHIIYPATQYLEQHYFDPGITNAVLAQRAGISEVYLRRLFLEQYGTTPKQYLLELRIQRAKQLLVDTSHTVTQVAEECGFSSVYHFCRVFKERTGITPTQFARQNRIFKI